MFSDSDVEFCDICTFTNFKATFSLMAFTPTVSHFPDHMCSVAWVVVEYRGDPQGARQDGGVGRTLPVRGQGVAGEPRREQPPPLPQTSPTSTEKQLFLETQPSVLRARCWVRSETPGEVGARKTKLRGL